MRALTICQPYAELIRRAEKTIENRTWDTNYRGLLLIHAGKSRQWLDLSADRQRDESYDIPLNEMDFGAVVAVAELCRSVPVADLAVLSAADKFSLDHRAIRLHAVGPFCFCLRNIHSLEEPIPCSGKQGLWVPHKSIIDRLPAFSTIT